jgi:hypothetical protein
VTAETVYVVNIMKPHYVGECSLSMLGLNLKDHELNPFLTVQKRGMKWYMELLSFLLNVAIDNAFIIRNETSSSITLARDLIW